MWSLLDHFVLTRFDIWLILTVDGGWSDWSMWTTCAVSCGVGNKTRDRTCTNPEPLHNGRKCNENSLELDSCSIKACPGNNYGRRKFGGCIV